MLITTAIFTLQQFVSKWQFNFTYRTVLPDSDWSQQSSILWGPHYSPCGVDSDPSETWEGCEFRQTHQVQG